ncbi:MAG: hypothetical protein ABJN36_14895 [Cyclobacteriaceae bacterium]
MKLKNLLLGLVIVVALGACSEDDEPKKSGGAISIDCQTFVTTDYLVILEDLQDAQAAYLEDQSTENCQAYYSALDTYVESWKAYVNKCVPQASAQFETYWATWETYFDDLNCGE